MPNHAIEFVLIHAPLVGPYTWALVADELRGLAYSVTVPELTSPANINRPYWQRHAQAVADALASEPRSKPLILVAHSGAGPLLPAVRAMLAHTVTGYLFVDAGLPENGKSRLDQFESEESVQQFRQAAKDGFLPVWTESDLREVIPDKTIRERFASELHPLPVAVYEEALPVFSGWPDAPVGYLRFGNNPAYEAASRSARRQRFPFLQLQGEHFHMLVNPILVARALVELAKKIMADQ
jgi:hypothetical protein